MPSKLSRAILITGGLSLLLAIFILVDASPYLRGGFGWRWPFQFVGPGGALLFLAVTLIYVGGAALLLYRVRRTPAVLAWAFLGAAIIPLVALTLRHDHPLYELLARTLSGLTTGAHLAAAELDWTAETLGRWPQHMADFVGYNVHLSTNPPGMALAYALLNRLFELLPGFSAQAQQALLPLQCDNFNVLDYDPAEWASAVVGMLSPVWAALAVFPLYTSARRLLSQEQAWWAATWWALVPGLSLFVASPNTILPLLSIGAFALLMRWQQSGRAVWLALSGAVMGLATFTYMGFFPLLAFFALYLALVIARRQGFSPRLTFQRAAPALAWYGVGLLLPWLIVWLASGLTVVDVVVGALTNHLDLERPYLPWLWLHFQDWALFTGVPLIGLWVWGVVRAVRSQRRADRSFVGLSLLVVIAILDLSGISRGETGRVWLMYSPFVLLAAAEEIPLLAGRPARPVPWGLITLGQVALCAALVTTWDVVHTDLTPPPAPPGGLMTTRPLNADFGGDFRLVSWDAAVEEGAIVLRLDWQAARQVVSPYWFAALLVDPAGAPTGETLVWQPLEAGYPTTCWTAGEWVGDTLRIPLPESAPAGAWWISLSSFADVDAPEQRITVTLPDGSQDTQVGIGPVTVP